MTFDLFRFLFPKIWSPLAGLGPHQQKPKKNSIHIRTSHQNSQLNNNSWVSSSVCVLVYFLFIVVVVVVVSHSHFTLL